MNQYNHKQFIEWLNGELDKQEKVVNDKLLVESKLSKYWKKRAARRAIKAGRKWPNGKDRKWALEEQEKSAMLNDSILKLFEKELGESELMVDDIHKVIRRIKAERKRMKMQREAAKQQTLDHPKKAMQRRAGGKSLSTPTPSGEGGPLTGLKRKIKKSKTATYSGTGYGPAGGVGAAMEESKEKN